MLAGRMATRPELKAAAGMGRGRSRMATSTGIDQARNVWLREPRLPLFNHHWVSYAFKNMGRFSPTLGDHRIASSQPLITKARQLWNIIRLGDEGA